MIFGLLDDLFETLGIGFDEAEKPKAKTTNSSSNIKADKEALKEFVNNFHWGDGLTDSQAKSNLENGIVEITDFEGTTCNGLLITENGYFITSYHCVADLEYELYIVTSNGKKYPIQKVCAYSKKDDVALVKANMPGSAKAMVYRFAKKYNIAKKFAIVMLSRNKTKLRLKGGYVHNPKLVQVERNGDAHLVENQIWIEVDSVPGDSGSIYSTMDHRIYGVHASGLTDDKKWGMCTFWFQVIKLINLVANPKKL